MERSRMGEIALSAGLGFAAGALLANPARKLAMEGAEALATRDWVEALTLEHRAVQKIFEALLQTSERDVGRRKAGLAAIDHALTKHAMQEETVIYPAVRRVDEDAAQRLFSDHFRGQDLSLRARLRRRRGQPALARAASRVQGNARRAHPRGGGRDLSRLPRADERGGERAADAAHAHAGR